MFFLRMENFSVLKDLKMCLWECDWRSERTQCESELCTFHMCECCLIRREHNIYQKNHKNLSYWIQYKVIKNHYNHFKLSCTNKLLWVILVSGLSSFNIQSQIILLMFFRYVKKSSSIQVCFPCICLWFIHFLDGLYWLVIVPDFVLFWFITIEPVRCFISIQVL